MKHIFNKMTRLKGHPPPPAPVCCAPRSEKWVWSSSFQSLSSLSTIPTVDCQASELVRAWEECRISPCLGTWDGGTSTATPSRYSRSEEPVWGPPTLTTETELSGCSMNRSWHCKLWPILTTTLMTTYRTGQYGNINGTARPSEGNPAELIVSFDGVPCGYRVEEFKPLTKIFQSRAPVRTTEWWRRTTRTTPSSTTARVFSASWRRVRGFSDWYLISLSCPRISLVLNEKSDSEGGNRQWGLQVRPIHNWRVSNPVLLDLQSDDRAWTSCW